MSTINALRYIALTTAINNMRSPNTFLQDLLYANHQTIPTETIELATIEGARTIAPLVKSNGEALMVQGTSMTSAFVAGPNIRVKMPFTPSELLFGRVPGTAIQLPVGSNQVPAVEQHIARDLQQMANMITNTTEWLVSMSLQGVISYAVEDGENITVTVPRSSDNNITLSVFWNDADPTLTRPLLNIHTVKEVFEVAGDGLTPTDAICGTEAAHALLTLVETGNIKMLGQQGLQVDAGQITFIQKFTAAGAIYLGSLGGVRFWQYGRTASLNGSTTNMIRPKYVEFIDTSSGSDRVEYFAAIPDFDALQGGKLQSERFAKSWLEKDPSRMMALAHSRPLPWPRRPNATVSMKVVSG